MVEKPVTLGAISDIFKRAFGPANSLLSFSNQHKLVGFYPLLNVCVARCFFSLGYLSDVGRSPISMSLSHSICSTVGSTSLRSQSGNIRGGDCSWEA